MKKIGILGGLGHAASAAFYDSLVRIAQKKYNAVQDADFPEVFMHTASLTGFNEEGNLNQPAKEQLQDALQGLAPLCDFIVIPCNTVHLAFKELQDTTSIPILNIVDCVVEEAKKYRHVGLLTSGTSRKQNLYQKPLREKGVYVFTTTDEEQKIIDNAVLLAMAGKEADISAVVERFTDDGAEAVILGCTELPLILKTAPIPILSSIELLAEATVRRAYT